MAATPNRRNGKSRTVGDIEIEIADVCPHPANPRRDWSEQQLKVLAASLSQHSLMQPIVVRHVGEGRATVCQLIAGERRLRAAEYAGWKTIPARVVDATDAEALEMVGVENLLRKDWNAIELGTYLRTLNQPEAAGGAGMTHAQIAKRFGHTESWAQALIRLLELPDDLQEKVASGELPYTGARALLPYLDMPETMAAIRENIAASPDDWKRRRDCERNAAFLADQVNQGQAAPKPAPKPAPKQAAAAARKTDKAPSDLAPTIRQHDAMKLVERFAENPADLKLICAVCHNLIKALRSRAKAS